MLKWGGGCLFGVVFYFVFAFSHTIKSSILPGHSFKQHSLCFSVNSAIQSPSTECPCLQVSQDGNVLYFVKTQVSLRVFMSVCVSVLTSAILTKSNVWKERWKI